jgi:acyl carrier protein
LYRTGDLVRWNDVGELEFIGRTDHQIKIRGFRIELGEIEAELLTQAGVRQAVVVALAAPGGPRLVGYVVGDTPLDSGSLRTALRERLPEYMVPSALLVLDSLPLNPNGKVDRRALPAPESGPREYAPPLGETEAQLAGIWQQVLGIQRIDRHADFFDLGGHSLSVMAVHQRIQSAMSISFPLSVLFSVRTLQALAARIDQEAASRRQAETQDIDDIHALLGMLND